MFVRLVLHNIDQRVSLLQGISKNHICREGQGTVCSMSDWDASHKMLHIGWLGQPILGPGSWQEDEK